MNISGHLLVWFEGLNYVNWNLSDSELFKCIGVLLMKYLILIFTAIGWEGFTYCLFSLIDPIFVKIFI